MNKEIRAHCTIFYFMNRLRMLFFENNINLITQSKTGLSSPSNTKISNASKMIVEKSKQAEMQYSNGSISAAALLRQAADHYNDDKVMEVFRDLTTINLEDSDIQEPPPPEVQAVEDDISVDERMWLLNQDPDLTDISTSTLTWETTQWINDNEVIQPEQTEPKEKVYSVKYDDVNDAVRILCTVCTSSTTKQTALNCGHFFCNSCINRPDMNNCPMCRTRIKTRQPINLGSITLSWKDDVPTNIDLYTQMLTQQLHNASAAEELVITGRGKNNLNVKQQLINPHYP